MSNKHIHRWIVVQHDDENIIGSWQYESYAEAKQDVADAADEDHMRIGMECCLDAVYLDDEGRLPKWFCDDHEVPKDYHLEILNASKPVH